MFWLSETLRIHKFLQPLSLNSSIMSTFGPTSLPLSLRTSFTDGPWSGGHRNFPKAEGSGGGGIYIGRLA